MRVDFYQLSRDPAEAVVPRLARGTIDAGERLLVVSGDAAQRARIGDALWATDGFLANGQAGGPHDARQPTLLSDQPLATNGARYIVLADGIWREAADGFERVFLLFDAATIDAARATWKMVRGRDGAEAHYWRQDGGRWTEVA